MIAILASVLIAAVVCAVVIIGDRTRGTDRVPVAPGWVGLVCGVLGVIALATPTVLALILRPGPDDSPGEVFALFPASIALGLIGLVSSGYALARRDRRWPVIVGIVAAGLVVAFWVVFIIGELVFPH